jgi:hypothetical protein
VLRNLSSSGRSFVAARALAPVAAEAVAAAEAEEPSWYSQHCEYPLRWCRLPVPRTFGQPNRFGHRPNPWPFPTFCAARGSCGFKKHPTG